MPVPPMSEVRPANEVESCVTTVTAGSAGRPLGALVRRTTGNTRVIMLTAAIGATAVILGVALVPAGTPIEPPFTIPVWLLAAMFYVAEARVFHLHIGRSAHSFSMSEIPVVIGLLLVAPLEFVIARAVGSGLALFFARRQRGVKLAFNIAQFTLCSVTSVAIVHLAQGADGALGPPMWLAIFAANIVENVIGVLTVSSAISLAEATPQYRRIPEMLKVSLTVSLTSMSLALMALTLVWANPSGLLLCFVPIVTAALAYRAYVTERQQHEALEMLHESTLILQRTPQLDAALVSLLDHARKMFRARVAEICLLPRREGDQILRTRVGPTGAMEVMTPIGTTFGDPLAAQAVEKNEARLFDGTGGRATEGDVGRRRNAMVAPLRGDADVVGVLIVADRLSDISAFDRDDLKLFETLANHTAVALENGQLEQSLAQLSELQEELREQAYHDALTGLANRSLFRQLVAEQLASPDVGGRIPIVLFIDLDDFKLVNDSLGHAAGDELLVAVAIRIREQLRSSDVAARLGGDEFAVLLSDERDMVAAARVAERLVAAFRPAFRLGEHEVAVRASIGLAAGVPGKDTASDLLRNADVAMYAAKAHGKGRVVIFEPSMHEAVVSRARLSSELERAIAAGEFILQYQPIVDLASGRARGAEALVRWEHPGRGRLPPDEFIRLAEESDAILEIGHRVLTEACRQARAWQSLTSDRPFPVVVNVAARQLAQPGFADEVLSIIEGSGAPPEAIVLEMTETAMLQDGAMTKQKLHRLRGAGIGISVDDFGTGYSSLSYLQRFPVTILRIARDFVTLAGTNPEEWELASAIIALGRALHLTVVAAGVERPSQLIRLRALGCEYAQGFYFARPLDPTALEAYILRGAATTAGAGAGPMTSLTQHEGDASAA